VVLVSKFDVGLDFAEELSCVVATDCVVTFDVVALDVVNLDVVATGGLGVVFPPGDPPFESSSHGFVSTSTIAVIVQITRNTTSAMRQFILQFCQHIFFLSLTPVRLNLEDDTSRSSERD